MRREGEKQVENFQTGPRQVGNKIGTQLHLGPALSGRSRFLHTLQ
jgi:hypothetical protein